MGFETSDLDSIRVRTRTERCLRQKGETNDSEIGWGWLQSTLLLLKPCSCWGPAARCAQRHPRVLFQGQHQLQNSRCPDLDWNPKHMRDKLILPLIRGGGWGWPAGFAVVSVASGKERQGGEDYPCLEDPYSGCTTRVSVRQENVKDKWISFGKIEA